MDGGERALLSSQKVYFVHHNCPVSTLKTEMDKLTIISGCLFLAADIFAIASIANPDWINTGESAGEFCLFIVFYNVKNIMICFKTH